jgi:alanyl-tRNA synthetase
VELNKNVNAVVINGGEVKTTLMTPKKAIEQGAMALFGEKYGDEVRVVTMGNFNNKTFSIELCGGTHVTELSTIDNFEIINESSIASGVRRIEAISSQEAENYYMSKIELLEKVEEVLGGPKDTLAQLEKILKENKQIKKELESLQAKAVHSLKEELKAKAYNLNGIDIILEKIDLPNVDSLKNILFGLKPISDNMVAFLAANIQGKPMLGMILSDGLTDKLNAGSTIRETAKEIKGGGGGQPFFATAGGSDINGLDKALAAAKEIIEKA